MVLSNLDCIPLHVWGDIPYLSREHYEELSLLSKNERLRKCGLRVGPGRVRLTITAHSFRGKSHAMPVVDIGVNTDATGLDLDAHHRDVGASGTSSDDTAAHFDDGNPDGDHSASKDDA